MSNSRLAGPSLDAAGTKKLESLAKALVERNSLKLEIVGRADPELRQGRRQACGRSAP